MIRVCRLDELPDKSSIIIMAHETPVAVFNAGGKLFAWDNRCPHRGASLGDGYITDRTIQCKYHLWEFDIEKECAVANRSINVKTFPVVVNNGEIFINI